MEVQRLALAVAQWGLFFCSDTGSITVTMQLLRIHHLCRVNGMISMFLHQEGFGMALNSELTYLWHQESSPAIADGNFQVSKFLHSQEPAILLFSPFAKHERKQWLSWLCKFTQNRIKSTSICCTNFGLSWKAALMSGIRDCARATDIICALGAHTLHNSNCKRVTCKWHSKLSVLVLCQQAWRLRQQQKWERRPVNLLYKFLPKIQFPMDEWLRW